MSELLLGGAAIDDWLLLSLEAELLSDRRGGGAGWLGGSICDGGNALAAVAALLSTRPAKISVPSGESDAGRENRGEVVGKDALVAASGVTLCTDGLSE